MLRTIAAHSLAFLLAASSIQAATVRGTVVGWDNPALAGARVTLANADTSVVLETRSAADGTYRFEAVPGGFWRVGASRLSYDYQEVLLVVGAAEIVKDFSLGAGVHPGRWTTIGNTDPENLYATNSASLLPDGRIFYCHDTLEPVLFNPINGAKSFPTSSPSQQGCHISTLLPDGRLVFIGGQDSGDFRDAVRTVKSFDATTGTWQVLPDLIEERWYPGLARLADGRLLVMGGGQRPNAQRTPTCEIYDPRTNAWTATASMSNPSDYPPALLLQTGKVLRSWWPPQLFDPSLNQWTNTGGMVQPNRFWPGHCDHTLVRLADGRACAIGIYRGSLVSPSMIELYDPGSGAWSLGANADVTRSQPEVALLPTGQVFVAGGKLEDSNPAVSTNTYGQTRLTDLYDPTTNTWRRCADMAWFREYHATTLLIPDGRVITTAGTGGPANPGVSNDVEAFEPPYLFRGIRPRIDGVSSMSLPHGGTLSLTVSRTNSVTSLALVGMSSVTHWVDGGLPLIVPVPFSQAGNTVTATIPSDANLAPAGHYLLFVMVDDIPSKAVVFRVTDSVTVSVPPQPTPGLLTGTIRPNPFTERVEVRWYQPVAGRCDVRIYDLSGRSVFASSQYGDTGWHQFDWDGRVPTAPPASGVYFLGIDVSGYRWTTRLVRLGN